MVRKDSLGVADSKTLETFPTSFVYVDRECDIQGAVEAATRFVRHVVDSRVESATRMKQMADIGVIVKRIVVNE